jgi:DNA repair exonuclease SbcCD nuclease subunit
MKIALITDTHAGINHDSDAFHDKSKLFYDNIFFPYLNENVISTVIHLGDIVDNRNYIKINAANRLRTDFLLPMEKMGLTVYFIAGNHDCVFKDTNRLNALKELVDDKYADFYVHDMDAHSITLDDLEMLLIPWISNENRDRIYKEIEKTTAPVAFGHLELKGFETYKGLYADKGDDASLFKKFDMVFSGHYHHKSTVGNIHYIGASAEFKWSDYDDPRGFHVFDTKTRKLTFIKNPYKMFRKVFYDEVKDRKIDFLELKNCIVKIVVVNKSKPFEFDAFLDMVEKSLPIDCKIVDDHLNALTLPVYDSENETDEDTLSIIFSCIDSLDEDVVKKSKLKELFKDLYESI